MIETVEIFTASTVVAAEADVSVVTDVTATTLLESTTPPPTTLLETSQPQTLLESSTSAPIVQVVDTVSQIQVIEVGAVGPQGPPGDVNDTLKSPTFSYASGKLTGVVYADGSTKALSYTGDQLTRIDLVRSGVTYRKDFFYSGLTLTHITETTL